MRRFRLVLSLGVVCLLSGCIPRFVTPFQVDEPLINGPRSVAAEGLDGLPTPSDKVVAAVYRFRDQTGQYKALENVSTFSNAVTQGATSILLRALEDSGWFVTIEREGLSNLLNERQIISATRQQYSGPDGEPLAPLPPLLYAGILLEGGIIGYDSNVLTGGAGVRYLGSGASGQYRQDQVTVYIRAVSVQNGRVLKTVHTTKSIVSQKLDTGVFRFVDTADILEAEAGYSANEPPVLAVTAAIEEAVYALIVEGLRDGLWSVEVPGSADVQALYAEYDSRRERAAQQDVFGRTVEPSRPYRFRAGGGLSRIEGDYTSPQSLPEGVIGVSSQVARGLAVGATGRFGGIDAGGDIEATYSGTLDVELSVLPESRLSPYLRVGVGIVNVPDAAQELYGHATVAVGIHTVMWQGLGLFLEGANAYPFSEGLDGLDSGAGLHDNVWMALGGLSVSF